MNIWAFCETRNEPKIKQFTAEREVGTRQLNYKKNITGRLNKVIVNVAFC